MGDISSFTELKLNIRHLAQCELTEMINLRELGFTPPSESKPHIEAGETGAQRCLAPLRLGFMIIIIRGIFLIFAQHLAYQCI